jgi:hypothetical protein
MRTPDPKPPDATVRFRATKSRASILEVVQSFLTDSIKSRVRAINEMNANDHFPIRRKFPSRWPLSDACRPEVAGDERLLLARDLCIADFARVAKSGAV